MRKRGGYSLFGLAFFILLYSCKPNYIKNPKVAEQEIGTLSDDNQLLEIFPANEDYKFLSLNHKIDFNKQELHTITFSLKNNHHDTIYLATNSCDGLIYQLSYDTTVVSIVPRIFCNASFPVILKIAPLKSYDFTANLFAKKTAGEVFCALNCYTIDNKISDIEFEAQNIRIAPSELLKTPHFVYATEKLNFDLTK